MRYANPILRDKLAAEYVIGTLRGAARARFQSLMKYDADLRARVTAWETRLAPLSLAARDIVPPAHVWARIDARIGGAAGAQPGRSWWASLALWRGLAVAGAVAALALGITLRNIPPPEPQPSTIAVMSDEKSQAAMVISWIPWSAQREPRIRVRIVTPHAAMPEGTAWELWMVPGGDAAPVSLGLVSLEQTQELPIRKELTASLGKAWGVALSVEPKGGSPTGKPTGPVIMKGPCVKVR